ncbi:MAG TPA: hypothetical protein VKA48_05870 [Gammaproteobacteria bacterium]|nr:hypothetical protein [Gammaproteobacteria bacterium]
MPRLHPAEWNALMSREARGWDRYLRKARSALAKRDVLLHRPEGGPGPDAADRREGEAWSARAKAYLRYLANLARAAPEPASARETLRDLERWYEAPRGDRVGAAALTTRRLTATSGKPLLHDWPAARPGLLYPSEARTRLRPASLAR